MREPLVSCIMPTADRRGFIPGAIRCFLEQSYDNRELVVVDDGDNRVKDLIPGDPRIRYFEAAGRAPLGKKRNFCCRMARGEIICHWDDDDWSAPGRIADQVARLRQTNAPVTGYSRLLFWDEKTQVVRFYKSQTPGYIVGPTAGHRWPRGSARWLPSNVG